MRSNFNWYEDRLDDYNAAFLSKMAELNVLQPGTVPVNLGGVCGMLDGHSFEICRPTVLFIMHSQRISYSV